MGQYQCVFGSVLNFVQVGVVVGCFFLLSFTYFFLQLPACGTLTLHVLVSFYNIVCIGTCSQFSVSYLVL